MNKIIALTDYKGFFGQRHDSVPYRSGFDKHELSQAFNDFGYEIQYIQFSELNFESPDLKSFPIIYTSQEDKKYYYKSYIEDIIYGLDVLGANIIPQYKYLKANNNKVFMEILRTQFEDSSIKNIKYNAFGTIEEARHLYSKLSFPIVVKGATGANSKNVKLARSKKELDRKLQKIATTKDIKSKLWELGRRIKHSGYTAESMFRSKFILQDYIPKLSFDWKIYIFGNTLYVFKRPIQKGRGFRASGGGYDNYLYDNKADVSQSLLEFAWKVFKEINVPHISLDIAYDKIDYYLLEFQCLYFGTAGVLKKYSQNCFIRENGRWIESENTGKLESLYAKGIVLYLEKNISA